MKRSLLWMGLPAVCLTLGWLGAAASATAAPATTAATTKKDAALQEVHGKNGAKPAAAADGDKHGARPTPHAGHASSQSHHGSSDSDGTAAPATLKVKRQRFKIDVALDGLFEAQHATEVVLRSKEWSDFEVLSAVEHGVTVAAGDVLVTLDTEKIDKTIADLQREQALARLGLQEAESLLAAQRIGLPMDLWTAERNKRIADEDMRYFIDVDRPLSERIVAFNVKTAENFLAYAQEELRQLEKMYKADDLVEETEEIVLKRTRDSVERAKFMAEIMRNERDSFLKMRLPRADEAIKAAADRQALDTQKAKATLPLALRRSELALEKLKIDSDRSEEKLKRLLADRSAMIVKAPVAGVVYYGRCNRGKWSGQDSLAEKLRRGGRLTADDVFMTIVEPRPLTVRCGVPEKQLQNVVGGLKAIVRPTGYPDLRLPAIVQSVSGIPLGAKDFDLRLTVANDEAAAAVVPGMSCDVRLIAYQKADALLVPVSAVGSDDDEPQKQFVSLVGKDGKTTRRQVTPGRRSDKQVEILAGLAEGDEILRECGNDLVGPKGGKDEK
jgi:multidrug resistance efflux pump